MGQRQFAEHVKQVGDAMADTESALRRLTPLALAGARPWITLPLVEFYRKVLTTVGGVAARVELRHMVAEALELEAAAISTSTGCGEHDALAVSLGAALAALAQLCTSKLQMDEAARCWLAGLWLRVAQADC